MCQLPYFYFVCLYVNMPKRAQPDDLKPCDYDECTNYAIRRWCQEHKEYQHCRNVGCNKRANFNIVGAGAQYCATHKSQDMINTKCLRCELCNKVPCFGVVGERPTRCVQHKTEAMEDLTKVCCTVSECSTIPVFGLDGERPTRCFAHKLDDMINVVKPKCELCTLSASFAIDGERPSRCNTHKTAAMVNVVNKRCVLCKRKACYGLLDAPATRCSDHRLEGMVSTHARRCELCDKMPNFGLSGQLPTRCLAHKTEEMQDVISPQCEMCPTRPTFGLEGGRPTRCYSHKTREMITVVKKTQCDLCEKIPIYGVTGDDRPSRCTDHKEDGMVDLVHDTCTMCTKRPSFGESGGKPTRCVDHKDDDMVNVVTPMCEHGMFVNKCRGSICGIRLGGKSHEEFFVTAAAYICTTPASVDHLEAYVSSHNKRIPYNNTNILPDLAVGINIFEYDGRYYHGADVFTHDSDKTAHLNSLGYTVTRYRDGNIADVPGCTNVRVDSTLGLENLAKQIAQHHGYDISNISVWKNLWISIDSLARRSILQFQQRNAKVKQRSVTDYLKRETLTAC